MRNRILVLKTVYLCIDFAWGRVGQAFSQEEILICSLKVGGISVQVRKGIPGRRNEMDAGVDV